MEIGDTLTAGQLLLPEGCVLIDPVDTPIASVRHPKLAPAATEEAAPAEAAAPVEAAAE
jgi:hypothetical protein